MDGDIRVSVDKLPIKRLDSIDENGVERFPSEVGPDEKRLALIRRIDFAPLVEKDAKKAKKSAKESAAAAAAPWPWQGLVENLQLAQQELSVIVDVISFVEANDAVTVAGMTRPKQLPNEILSDFAVSAATKLQFFRSISRYFKQSKKALENQIAREARFYTALIRLQQNWKVKRHRMPAIQGSEGFTIDLFDSSVSDPAAMLLSSSASVVRVDHDSSGMLSINVPSKSYRLLQFGFLGDTSSVKRSSKNFTLHSKSEEAKKEIIYNDDVDKSVKAAHSTLREIRQAIFDEQVFDLVNREAFHSSFGVNVNSIREDYLQLGVGQEASIYLSLVPYRQEADSDVEKDLTQNAESSILALDKLNESVKYVEKKDKLFEYPNPVCCEIYLRQILHENVFLRGKEKHLSSVKRQQAQHSAGDGNNVLGHFCMTLAHRLFSKKVLIGLENLVSGVPYLHLSSHPTWHSRTSSWSLSMKVPQTAVHAKHLIRPSDATPDKNVTLRSQFNTKVVVRDESISVSGEGAPNVVGLFRGGEQVDVGSMNSYDCNLEDLPMMLLQQVASQVVLWLHEEALVVGIKAARDFLALSFELDEGDTLSLVAHVDADDDQGCISWWLLLENASTEESRYSSDLSKGDGADDRKFLGYLSLESLYSILMDLVGISASRIMSTGVSPIGVWLVRQRHGHEFASCEEGLEDDASSSLLVSFLVQRSRSWAQMIGDVLWIASAAFVVYVGDRSSNFFYLLWGDNRIRRIPLYLGALCAILIVGIVSYTAFWTWYMRKVNNKWEALSSSLAPAVALLGLTSFGLLAVALWPVWSFLTLPLLFTLFMASMVVAPHLTFWFLTVDDGYSSALRTD